MDKVTSFPEDETVEDQITFYMELLARRSSNYSGARPDEMQYRAFAVFWARLQDEGLVNNHRDFFTAVAALCHCIHLPKTGAMAHFYGYLLRIAFLEDGEPNVDKTEQAFEYLREALDDFCPWYSRDVQPARQSESQTLSAVRKVSGPELNLKGKVRWLVYRYIAWPLSYFRDFSGTFLSGLLSKRLHRQHLWFLLGRTDVVSYRCLPRPVRRRLPKSWLRAYLCGRWDIGVEADEYGVFLSRTTPTGIVFPDHGWVSFRDIEADRESSMLDWLAEQDEKRAEREQAYLEHLSELRST